MCKKPYKLICIALYSAWLGLPNCFADSAISPPPAAAPVPSTPTKQAQQIEALFAQADYEHLDSSGNFLSSLALEQ